MENLENLIFQTFRDLALYLKSKNRYKLEIPLERNYEIYHDNNRGTNREMGRNRSIGFNYG